MLFSPANDRMKEMIQENYNRIRAEVRQIVADELQRIQSDPVRPGTATPLAGQVKNATGKKRKIRNSAVLFRPGYGFSLIMKNAPQVCCLAARLGGLLSVAFVLLFGTQEYQVEIHQPGVHGLHGCSLFRRPPAVQERPFLFLRGEQELEAVAQVKVKDLGTVQCVHHYITASCLVQRLDEPRLDGVQQFVAYVQSLIVLADGKLPYQHRRVLRAAFLVGYVAVELVAAAVREQVGTDARIGYGESADNTPFFLFHETVGLAQ